MPLDKKSHKGSLISSMVRKLGRTVSLAILLTPQIVCAKDIDGKAQWNIGIDYLMLWIPRGGFVMLFGGAIEYMIAYQTDDSRMKTQALRFMVSGGMVLSITWALKDLMYA